MTLAKMTRYYDLLAVEVCCVTAYVVDIFIFSRLYSFSRFVEQGSSKLFCGVVTLMVVDILVAFMFPILHARFRLTRVLRPLIGILKVEEMRTFCLHILGVLRGVTNVMVLTLFLLIIFGVVGVVLVPMKSSATQIGFDNIFMAVLNLGVLLTTENFPMIMHDTLDNSGPNYWWVLYYAVFLFIGLLVVNNLVLAVVWDLYKDLFAASALDQRVIERKQLLQAFALLDCDKKEYIDSVVWWGYLASWWLKRLWPSSLTKMSMYCLIHPYKWDIDVSMIANVSNTIRLAHRATTASWVSCSPWIKSCFVFGSQFFLGLSWRSSNFFMTLVLIRAANAKLFT